MRPKERLTPEQIENIEEFILESITGVFIFRCNRKDCRDIRCLK